VCHRNGQYQYDAGNRLTSETDTVNGTATTTNYTYDASNQLTSAGNTQYSYDPNGNRTMAGYQTGTGNELQSDGVWDFRYDPEGNLIEKDGISNGLIWKYAWDNANHLLTATEYNASTGAIEEQETNFWDVFGNLIEGLSPGQQGTGGTAPVWADLNGSNQIESRRLYLNAIDGVFARIGSGGGEAWYLSDHLGSLRGLMNNSGTLIDTLAYDAYGNSTSESSPSNGDRFKFASGQFDALTGLELFGRRWYSPADGIWVSQDPLGLQADSNLYRYVGNDPTTAKDPTGLFIGQWLIQKINEIWASREHYILPYQWDLTLPGFNLLFIHFKKSEIGFQIQFSLTTHVLTVSINGAGTGNGRFPFSGIPFVYFTYTARFGISGTLKISDKSFPDHLFEFRIGNNYADGQVYASGGVDLGLRIGTPDMYGVTVYGEGGGSGSISGTIIPPNASLQGYLYAMGVLEFDFGWYSWSRKYEYRWGFSAPLN
jgi:RHS repeat-associated protein